MRLSAIIPTLSCALILSSCSLFNKITGKTEPENTTGNIKVETVKTDKKAKKGKKDNNSEAKPNETLGTMPTTDQLLGAQWSITGVGSTVINAEDDTPYIIFDDKGRFYASDGCNIINGDYLLRSNGKLSFSNVLSTMKMCPDITFSDAVASALNGSTPYTVDCKKIGQETYLYLRNEKGSTALTLRRHNMEFLNGNWRITSADGKKIDDEEATVFLDIPELKIHGNTGCNFFNGDIYIDPARSNAIDFSNMGLTRMACPKSEQERAIMVGLEQTATAIAGKHADTALLLDNNGKQVMTLKKIATQPEEN